MELTLTPNVNFNNQCAEAFRFYRQVLGGEIVHLQTYGESPMKDQLTPEWHDRVMHARLVTGSGAVLMGSDLPPGVEGHPQAFDIALGVRDPAEADRIYAALSEGGRIQMAIHETFWAKRFAMFTDRFGIPWMVNC